MHDLLYHLDELRKRLLLPLICFISVFGASYYYCDFIIKTAVFPLINMENRVSLIYTKLEDGFNIYMNISTTSAFLTTLPIFIWQIYRYCAVGMYKNERQFTLYLFFTTILLFIFGNVMAYHFILPLAIKFFMSYSITNDAFTIMHYIRLPDYIEIFSRILIYFGIGFQLPNLILILHISKIATINSLTKYRRHLIVVVFIISAIFTPPDILSQIIFASILLILLQAGIVICKLYDKWYKIKSV